VPLTTAQSAAFLGGGATGLVRLEHLETAWALAPAFLRAVLRSSPVMRRRAILTLEWSRAPWFGEIAGGWTATLLEGRAGAHHAPELRARGLFAPIPVVGVGEQPPEQQASVQEMDAVVVACAQAHADALAEAHDEEDDGSAPLLELWCYGDAPSELVSAAALAEARVLCPGLVLRAPRDVPWPHAGDCTSECSSACTAAIDWGLLHYRG